MTLKEKATDLYNMIGQGQLLEGFDKYYAENIVMTEPRGTREGKSECRNYEVQFLNNVKEFHGQDVKNIAADEDKGTVFVEVAMDVTFQDGMRVNMEQVSVQKWENGQIVHERFYYDNGQG